MLISGMAAKARFTCACGGLDKPHALRLILGTPHDLQAIARFICDKALPSGAWERVIMSDAVITPPKVEQRDGRSADRVVFAQVEKWLAVIRELVREQAKTVS
jgi:hypothetical protein